jgi:hypothetical protein
MDGKKRIPIVIFLGCTQVASGKKHRNVAVGRLVIELFADTAPQKSFSEFN